MPHPRPEAHAVVLLIESDEAERTRLGQALRREGYEVLEAPTGANALQALSVRSIDLIITSPRLPGFADAPAVPALHEIAPEVPLIVFARQPTVEQAVLAMKQGASEYVTPDAVAGLPAVAARALERRGRRAAADYSAMFADAPHRADVAGRALDAWAKAMPAQAHVLALVVADGHEYFPCREARRLASTTPVWSAVLDQLGQPTAAGQPLSPAELLDKGLTGVLVAPLRVRRNYVGTLFALRRSTSGFSSGEVARAAELADRMAGSLHPVLRLHELDDRIRELELHRDQTVQTEKLALARKLAGGIAHEINNPLAFVRANLEALRDYMQTAIRLVRGERARPEMSIDELVTEIESILSESHDGLVRIGELIRNFQLLSQPHVAARHETVALTELVDGCIASVTAAGAAAERPGRRFVRETQQALTARAGKIDLQTGLAHIMSFLRDRPVVGHPDTQPVRLRIASDGGRPCVFVFDPHLELPEAERASLFDPQLTVEETRGQRRIRLDLELALAHQLLVRAGGIVSLQPGPNSGLIFRVRFEA